MAVGLSSRTPVDPEPARCVRRQSWATDGGPLLRCRIARVGSSHRRAGIEHGLKIVMPDQGAGRVVTFVGEWGAEDLAAADDGFRWFYPAVAGES